MWLLFAREAWWWLWWCWWWPRSSTTYILLTSGHPPVQAWQTCLAWKTPHTVLTVTLCPHWTSTSLVVPGRTALRRWRVVAVPSVLTHCQMRRSVRTALWPHSALWASHREVGRWPRCGALAQIRPHLASNADQESISVHSKQLSKQHGHPSMCPREQPKKVLISWISVPVPALQTAAARRLPCAVGKVARVRKPLQRHLTAGRPTSIRPPSNVSGNVHHCPPPPPPPPAPTSRILSGTTAPASVTRPNYKDVSPTLLLLEAGFPEGRWPKGERFLKTSEQKNNKPTFFDPGTA